MNVVAISQISRYPKSACTRCDWPALVLYVRADNYEAGEALYQAQGGLCEDCFKALTPRD